jgi:hypothetical protein
MGDGSKHISLEVYLTCIIHLRTKKIDMKRRYNLISYSMYADIQKNVHVHHYFLLMNKTKI